MKNESKEEVAKFFVGGIPPSLRFEIEMEKLFYLVESHKDDPWYKDNNPACEVAWVGLIAHFEAFCKHQFAALINICPSLLSGFSIRRPQTTLRLADIVPLFGQFEQTVGFVVAEQYDFGSPGQINGLFRDLLNVTPFSSTESARFTEFLSKRHLFVHHAGILTLQFLEKTAAPEFIKEQAFRESVSIATEAYGDMSQFLFEMNLKLTCATVRGIRAHIGDSQLSPYQTEGIALLLQGVYDTVDENQW